MHLTLWINVCLLNCLIIVVCGDFNLVVLHTNDVHARIEQTNKYSANCSQEDVEEAKCYGGMARSYSAVQEIRKNYSNVILLNAGDFFQGSIWFTYYKGLAASYFMNLFGYDVMTLGNHEFDLGTADLTSIFLKNVDFPVLACNVESPLFEGLIQGYTVLNISGQLIGVVGYITEKTAYLTHPAYLDGTTFTDVITCVQENVNKLQDLGINKIIALGHSGMDQGKEVAQKVSGVDLVVEGHSNTFLYNGDPPSNEDPVGPYPEVVVQDDGTQVPVVQAYAYTKYLGMLDVTFNDDGDLISWSGNPILLDNKWQQDPDILDEVETWREPLINYTTTQVGTSYVLLQGGKPACRTMECNLGNIVTDAVIADNVIEPTDDSSWSDVGIAIWNGGGIRVTLAMGPVTLANVFEVLPFRNEIEKVWITGSTLKRILEHSVTDLNPEDPPGRFLQYSGLKVAYNLDKSTGQRVDSVQVRCTQCQVPAYVPLDPKSEYAILTNNFLVAGGDGYDMLRDNIIRKEYIGTLIADVIRAYLEKTSPIIQGLEGRISFVKDPPINKATNINNNTSLVMVSVIIIALFYY